MWLEDIDADVASLDAFYAEVRSIADLEDDRLFTPTPGVSAWSAGHHLFHITLANELALRNVRMLVEGKSKWIAREGAPSLLGMLTLYHGIIPRGVGQAPRAVTPPAAPNPDVVRETLVSNVADLDRIRADLPAVVAAPGGIPHADLGLLSAPRWLRFAGLHGWHHLRIMREVLEAAPTGA